MAPVDVAKLSAVSDWKGISREYQEEAGHWTKIETDEEEAELIDLASEMNKAVKTLDSARLETTAPLRKQVETINLQFRGLIEPLSREVTRLRNLLTEYRAVKRKRAAEEAARVEAENRKRQEAADRLARLTEQPREPVQLKEAPPAAPSNTAKGSSGQATAAKTVVVKAVDVRQMSIAVWEGQLPAEVFSVNHEVLRRLYRAGRRFDFSKHGCEVGEEETTRLK